MSRWKIVPSRGAFGVAVLALGLAGACAGDDDPEGKTWEGDGDNLPAPDTGGDATADVGGDVGGSGDVGTTDAGPSDAAATDAGADAGGGADAGPDTGGTGDATADAGDAGPLSDPEKLLSVEATETWTFDGLSAPVQVIRTEGNVPHIYGATREDVAFVFGFVSARDRFFMMDLARRLGLGTLSELLGDAVLAADQQARASGQRFIAEQTAATMAPELAGAFDAYAAGVNAYIEQVKAGKLPLPTEMELAGGLLGADDPADLMKPFDRLSLAGIVVVAQYEASFETGDVGRTAVLGQLDGMFQGAALEALRHDGAIHDIWENIAPIVPIASAPSLTAGMGTGAVSPLPPGQAGSGAGAGKAGKGVHIPAATLERLSARLEAFVGRMRRDPKAGFGSNVWAVAGAASTDGRSLLAGDGHLSLSVPSFLFQLGLDTTVLGGGDVHQLGLTVPGLPMMGLGTNGDVAWSHTQQMGDITDWYAEQVKLDDNGEPVASLFEGEWKPVQVFEDAYVVADIPLLGSTGRTETWRRWTTFDGRWIAEIEGRKAKADEELAPGEALVNLGGDLVVPGDQDGDGVVSAISFDYTGLDSTGFAGAIDAMGHAGTVDEFHEAMRGLNAYTQNFVVADQQGSILYSGYQGVPCRAYLERDADGRWVEGADPSFLLDGTVYGGFTVPMTEGKNVEGDADPYRCIVPFAAYPTEKDPAQGYLVNSNNDPGGMGFDKDLSNDPWYIGGPYDGGVRADTISGELQAAIAAGEADLSRMQAIQGNVRSRFGEWFSPYLVGAIDHAKALVEGGGELTEDEARLVALYEADPAGMDAVRQRLAGWQQLGFVAASGVETFYSTPAATDAQAAVATTIHNAWIGAMMRNTFDDEAFPGIWRPGGTDGRIRTLKLMLEGRGEGNPGQLASWNPDTGESVFFDKLGTDAVEQSDEIMLASLAEALAYLRGPSVGPGAGGFASEDMGTWLWGLRHQVKFESILSDFLDSSSDYAFIADLFAVDTSVLPLADAIAAGDPRKGLKWFPRQGDQDSVDAANSGLNGKTFNYGSGPVMRMVVALGGGTVEGRNIVPGGQSGLKDSPFFHDQLELWLANDTFPLRFFVDDVVAGAIAREEYAPAP